MKERYKKYFKLNIMSLIFIAVSFLSVTLAWFAYSGLTDVTTEIGVKAWYIELEKDGETVSNDIVISLSEIYPGMNTVTEEVSIKNMGDSDAQIKYDIVSARILDDPSDNFVVDETTTSEYVEDELSHEYPFHINMNLSKGYAISQTGESTFKVSISWPLDSGNNSLDTTWGTNAYNFQESEEAKQLVDPEYQILPSIQVVISVTAEQYLEDTTTSDPNYNLGDSILYDVISNATCTEISSTCLQTYVIDTNNTIGDTTVTLLPIPSTTYISDTYANYSSALSTLTSTWTVNNRALTVDDMLKVVSTDITDSLLTRTDLSDSIIGNLLYTGRMNTEINRVVTGTGYFKFITYNYNYLSSSNCYWINNEYDTNNGFAIINIDSTNSKIYPETKTTSCNVVPVLEISKDNL